MRCYGSKPASFLALNPSGGIPLILLDGKVIKESKIILDTIESEFPSYNPLTLYEYSPKNLIKLERKLFTCWFKWLTSGSQMDEYYRKEYLYLINLVEEGLEANKGPYFMGQQFTMIDILFAPFLERMSASLPYYKGLIIRGNMKWPCLQKWFGAMESRPTYINSRNDYYSHVHNLPPQIGKCFSFLNEKEEKYALEIDGKLVTSWKYPLNSKNDIEGVIDETKNACNESKMEAAYSIISNNKKVVRFACRGTGFKGYSKVDADYSDPYFLPDETMETSVDVALRIISYSLILSRNDAKNLNIPIVLNKKKLEKCMEYLRDRIGVPRDMKYPAARHLRASINWFIDEIL
mmetsp:Transcript_12453/g.18695  ORF Transcript_12453/g.18695 Transcript_12453/m.18695 type:complete len:349 (-) Transcript_12453:59-1105(-)